MALPILHLGGTTYEQGLQHGRRLRSQVHHNREVYFHRFEHESELSRKEVLRRAALYAPEIRLQNPDYYAGMEGIAEGSDSPFEEIVALNVRYEIIYYQSMVSAMRTAVDGCTAFAISSEKSFSGHLLLGQNWDWIPHVSGAVLHTSDVDGKATLAFTEAGIFGGKIGVNAIGLGLAVNGLTSISDDWSRLNKPFHVRCYEILRANSIDGAIATLTKTDRACSGNFLIAQAPDRAVDIEAAPFAINCLYWNDGCIVHTNHFIDPTEMGISEPPGERRLSSCNRMERMDALLHSTPTVDIGAIKDYLKDHVHAPTSICRHEDPTAPVGEQYRTVTSVIMDLNNQTMLASDGPPCDNDFQTFAL
jgi:isopenicillin-N N-acyltransferase-like protein